MQLTVAWLGLTVFPLTLAQTSQPSNPQAHGWALIF